MDWSSFRRKLGSEGVDVEAAIAALLAAAAPGAARSARAELVAVACDDLVHVHEIAEPITAAIVGRLDAVRAAPARIAVVEWLARMVFSFPSDSEFDQFNDGLIPRMVAEIGGRLDALYPWLDDPDPIVAADTLRLLHDVDRDAGRVARALDAAVARGGLPAITARQILAGGTPKPPS